MSPRTSTKYLRRSARLPSTGPVTLTPTISNADSPSFKDDAGVEYAEFIEAELDDQRAAKTSFEQRGLAVVTTSAALVAALFGFVGFLTKRDDFQIPHLAIVPLVVALVFFVMAARRGLGVNRPVTVRGPTPNDPDKLGLEQLVQNKWADPPAKARQRIAMLRTGVIADYNAANEQKAKTLIGAIRAEVGGVLALAVTVGLILLDSI